MVQKHRNLVDKWVESVYLCEMVDKLSKEEQERLRLGKLAQEADKERVKAGWWYTGKIFSSPIKTKKI